jgi:FKBP-type peptidyl-prolyl cis-trans isomerase
MILLLLSLLACATADSPAAPAAEIPASTTPAAKKSTERPKLDIPAPADVAAPPADAVVTASGLASKVVTAGTGTEHPTAKDKVTVHYTGWTTDGAAFDSSSKRGKPATFGLGQVIAGWTEGVQLMVVGEKRRFWIPEELAYKGKPGKPAGMLVFDVELVEIVPAPKPIPAPEDVAAPSKGAKRTKSGLAYKVLTKGTGKEHPTAESMVVVDYTGWNKAGEMFDSSVVRGKPASFSLGGVIPGWTEGVQLMVVGEKTRFWIPAEQAYGETPKRPGAPSGDLTFDIELKEIKDASEMPTRGQRPTKTLQLKAPPAEKKE